MQVRLTEVISSNSSRAEVFEYLQISLAAEPISGLVLAYTDGTADIRADQENTIFSATNKTNEEFITPRITGDFLFQRSQILKPAGENANSRHLIRHDKGRDTNIT